MFEAVLVGAGAMGLAAARAAMRAGRVRISERMLRGRWNVL